jgi:hypothetical protein
MIDRGFDNFDVESFFVLRLAQQGTSIAIEIATPEQRKQRVREAIIESGKEFVIIGAAPNGKPETYAQCFERHYREPLSRTGRN